MDIDINKHRKKKLRKYKIKCKKKTCHMSNIKHAK